MHQPQKTGLIVDDEKWVQYVLLKQLELLGYECEFARSGQEALEKVAAKEFDLMMLDMMLKDAGYFRLEGSADVPA